MEILSTLVYNPIYNILIYLYDTIAFEDFGIAIILTTLLLKLVFIPLSKKQIESQKQLQELQPKIKAIQQKYKSDKERQTKEIMAFYKEKKINPFGGCLPLIVQIIFLFAIYRILFNISESEFVIDGAILYNFVSNPGSVETLFLGALDLSKPNMILAGITAIAQYWQTKTLLDQRNTEKQEKKQVEKKKENEQQPDFAQMMSKQMLYIGPALTLIIGVTFPAGLMVYWLTSTLFMLGQQQYVEHKKKSE